MKLCLACMEMSYNSLKKMPYEYIEYGLVSYLYLKDNEDKLNLILQKCKKLLVDSGAHTFQHGDSKTDLDVFLDKYCKFVEKNYNNPKIEGFFELDVDNVIGYNKVMEYRNKLEQITNKIIPVWHNNRGVNDYIDMCKKYSNRRIAITGFNNNDIKDSQYNLFINEAHKYGCKIHILGCTRFNLIKTLNLGVDDSFDSSSYRQDAIFGNINLINKDDTLYKLDCLNGIKIKFERLLELNILTYKRLQEKYSLLNNDKGDVKNEC